VGTSPQAQPGADSSAQDARQPVKQASVSHVPVNDAVVTTVFTSIRKPHRLKASFPSIKPKAVAKSIASKIIGERDDAAHRGLDELGAEMRLAITCVEVEADLSYF